MSVWGCTKLGDIAYVTKLAGYEFTKFFEYVEDGEIIALRGLNLKNGRLDLSEIKKIRNSVSSNLPRSKLSKGDLLLSYTGTLGQIARVDEDNKFHLGPNVCLIRPNYEVFGDFLFNYLRSSAFRNSIEASSVGSTQPTIPMKNIRLIEIPLPPITVQKAIASVLSSLDDKIDLLHRQNTTLERMAEALFRQWFVEAAREDWEETKIKDFDVMVCDFVANGSFAALKENVTLVTDKEDYALFIRNTDLKSNFSTKVYVTEHSYNFLKKTKLFGGEIIISSVGDVGSVFRCPKFNIPMTLGNNVIMLKSVFNYYFYLFFKSDFGQSLIYGITSGSVQEKFNKTAFRDLILAYPSIEYIKNFEQIVAPWFSRIDLNNSQIQTLEKLRDNLLPKLMGNPQLPSSNFIHLYISAPPIPPGLSDTK